MVKPSGQAGKDTKARILEAADAVFVRHGTDGARMQQIADEAGVNKALLHYYFRTKAELAEAVWRGVASSFVPGVLEMMASDASLDEKIDRFVDAYLTRLSRHPYLVTYVVSEAARSPDRVRAFYSSGRAEQARRVVRKLRAQIGEGIKEGRMARTTPEQFFVTLAAACVYPFAARPLIAAGIGFGAKGFDAFIKRRRRELPAFLKRALRT